MFSSRQYEEVNPLVEISFAAISPGAVGGTATVATAVAFKLGSSGSSQPATFALGDQLEIFPSAASATNGIAVYAAPTATPGTAEVYFQNNTGGSITPVASSVYTIIATRLVNTLVS